MQEIAHEGGEECCACIEVVLGLGLASQLQEEPPWSEFLQIPDGQEVLFAEVVSHNGKMYICISVYYLDYILLSLYSVEQTDIDYI